MSEFLFLVYTVNKFCVAKILQSWLKGSCFVIHYNTYINADNKTGWSETVSTWIKRAAGPVWVSAGWAGLSAGKRSLATEPSCPNHHCASKAGNKNKVCTCNLHMLFLLHHLYTLIMHVLNPYKYWLTSTIRSLPKYSTCLYWSKTHDFLERKNKGQGVQHNQQHHRKQLSICIRFPC